MTSQQHANEALALYQANRDCPREILEGLLAEFFGIISAEQYAEQLRCVELEMGKCVIFTSDLPPHLSAAL
jgi:hypothetical protein